MDLTNKLQIATIALTIIIPTSLLVVTRFLDFRKSTWNRRMGLYRTLVKTRMEYNSREHISALDEIKLEYPLKVRGIIGKKDSPKNKELISALDAYLKKIEISIPDNISQEDVAKNSREITILQTKFLTLLGKSLGLEFDPSEYVTS